MSDYTKRVPTWKAREIECFQWIVLKTIHHGQMASELFWGKCCIDMIAGLILHSKFTSWFFHRKIHGVVIKYAIIQAWLSIIVPFRFSASCILMSLLLVPNYMGDFHLLKAEQDVSMALSKHKFKKPYFYDHALI